MNKPFSFLLIIFFPLALFACFSDATQTEDKAKTADFVSSEITPEALAFEGFMQNFDTISPPCQVGILPKMNKLTDAIQHHFLRTQLHDKPLVNIPNEFEGLWKRTHHNKFHIGEHKPMAGVAVISQTNQFILLEIADLEEFNYQDSLYSFRKTTFLCTFTPKGQFINGLAACYSSGDPMGGVQRKTLVSKDLKIRIEEYGFEKIKLPKGYKLEASYQVESDGKFTYLDAKVVK
jgi:hypothetical protein